METLIQLNEIREFPADKTRQLFGKYVNPGLASMVKLLNFHRKFVKAQNLEVVDDQGKVYLDFLGAFGALNFGHNHPYILAAINDVSREPKILPSSLNPYAAALGHNLAVLTPGDLQVSFFCNSGAEAVESALKLAKAATKRHRFVYCQNAFHGKTLGALAVTGREKYRQPFEPLGVENTEVPYNDLEQLELALQMGDVAAFIVEPIQGEGGIVVPDTGYLLGAQNLCHKHGVLLIVDEVQTGLGRTGYNFACQSEDVVPDILCLAKSLGGGIYPMGACVTSERLWRQAYGTFDRALLHTTTFGGNTVACVAALASLELLVNEQLAQQAAEKGAYFLHRCQALIEHTGLLKEVRGRGLLMGLEFNTSTLWGKRLNEYIGAMVAGYLLNAKGIITAYTLNRPNIIRLEPPLTVTYEQLDDCLLALKEALGQRQSYARLAFDGVKSAWPLGRGGG